ncbi:TetR/AcrR family transcriptional regulator [Sinosporangium siamense]|uniref:TetR family transcriptional regulator n=1 Tax=Sinosporangium siamense TaxID=1367973 RepID=A0A919RDT9_9ACTN|nr:TetR/AcrR family transcriptional regulator [Sinosporangium siamense]GII92065.1 TetR family transcriptional regulator [Sinosporangium siamense]
MRTSEKASLIEEIRRRQIVTSAIETIAGSGFNQASLTEIARNAGVSKGVIGYHFEGKDELIQQVVTTLLRESNDYIKERVRAQEKAADQLRVYIEASFAFMGENRANFVALVDIWGSFGSVAAKRAFNATAYEPCRRHLSGILRAGQEKGEFRDFPVETVATMLQGAVDGVMLQWVFDERAVDLAACAAELTAMFDRATAVEP